MRNRLLTLGVLALLGPQGSSQSLFGTGCPGSSGTVPSLALGSGIKPGLPFAVEVHGAPSTLGVLLLGLNSETFGGLALPFDLGAADPGLAGCALQLAPLLQVPVSLDSSGLGTQTFEGWQVGLEVFWQVWNVDVITGDPNFLGGFSPGYAVTSTPVSGLQFRHAFATTSPSTTASDLVTYDLDGDLALDLISGHPSSDELWVVRLDPNGHPEPAERVPVGDTPVAVVAGDFNGDGFTDLATANLSSDDVSVLLGSGDGTFGTQRTVTVEDGPRSVTTGDFNGDGLTDLATANRESDDVSVLLNQSEAILLGDVNLDGMVDLLDVAVFVQILTDDSFLKEADINEDCVVDLLDVAPFVQLLLGP